MIAVSVIGVILGVAIFSALSHGAVRPELAAALLLALLLPVWSVRASGTKTYSAMLYRVVVRRRRDDGLPGGFRTERELQLYPKNFKNLYE